MGDPSLRIALLSPRDWPEVRRGTERFTRELAAGLIARGQRPTLITTRRGGPHRTTEDGLPIVRLRRIPGAPALEGRFEDFLADAPPTWLALRRHDFDVAHAMHPSVALATAGWRRGPAILSYMGIPRREWLASARGRMAAMRAAVRCCDAVVVLSHHAAAAYRDAMSAEPRVIPPGVDLEAFAPGADRTEHPTIVCSAAPEVERKHVGLLVRAFALVRRRHPEAELILSRPRDSSRAARAGVDLDAPGVRALHLDDRRALARVTARAWAAVLPAADEAFGLVLAEALACGTPVVGFADGGIPEIIDGPAVGRLFHELTPEALASALLDVLALAGRPDTAAACRARAADFSTERCAERYLALYRELSG